MICSVSLEPNFWENSPVHFDAIKIYIMLPDKFSQMFAFNSWALKEGADKHVVDRILQLFSVQKWRVVPGYIK